MRVGSWGILVLSLGAAAGCQPKAESAEQAQARMDSETAAVRTVIDSVTRDFATHFNQGHGDIVASYYGEQAHLMPPNLPVAVGREAIKAAFAPFFTMKPDLKLTPDAVVANGPLAIERGTYSLTYTPPGATAPVTDTGKYLVHWHLLDGKWMLVDDIWNSDLPAMPMGPPAQKP
jgi:ketosteroid isomerase-like protein